MKQMKTVRSSDLSYTPEKIEGTILEKSTTGKGNPIGIVSDGNKKIHFNAKSFVSDSNYQIDDATIGDVVRFFVAAQPDDRLIAKNISLIKKVNMTEKKLEPVIDDAPEYVAIDNSSLYSFFRPGYSSYILADKDSFFSKAKMDADEIEVVEKLSRLLHVSSIKSQKARHGGIQYPFCILGATKNIKEYVRGQYEFLLVFSCFDNKEWQQATLNVHKAIRTRSEVSERPLPNFYMLVSNARKLMEEVRKTKGGSDAAIIPLSIDEVLSCDSDDLLLQLILSRFGEFYYANNMFNEKNAIEEDKLLFGNRGTIAQSIVERCLDKKHSGIFGLRRSGKSSVLKAVSRRLDKLDVKHVTIDSGDIEGVDSWKTALYIIARKVCMKCRGIEQEEVDQLTREEENQLLKLNSTQKEYEKSASICFKEDIRKYIHNEKVFVISFDEIEGITYNTTTSAVWKDLESYKNFWSSLRDSGCSLIICGVNATINEKNSIEFNGKTCDNPMYERIHSCSESSKTYLPAFTDEETKEMINTLGGYSNIAFDNVYSEINRAFGGQPYAIRQFCSYAYERVKQYCQTGVYELSRSAYKQLFDEFIHRDGRKLISTILEHIRIYPEEYATLKKIALSPEKHRSIDLNDRGRIDHLEKYGIIDYDDVTGFVSFKIEPIQDYLRDQESKDPKDMDNTERRRYVQDRVAECERKLKRYILLFFSFNDDTVSESKARKIMKQYTEIQDAFKGRIDPDTCDLDDFFDHKKFTLYFSKLRLILCDYWHLFKKDFLSCNIDKDQLSTYLKELNAGRTDADHYDAEDDTCPPEKWEIDEKTMDDFQHGYKAMKQFFIKKKLDSK